PAGQGMRPGRVKATPVGIRRGWSPDDGSLRCVRYRQEKLPGNTQDTLESRRPADWRNSRWRRLAHAAPGDRQRQTLAAGRRRAERNHGGTTAKRNESMAYRVLIV